MSNTIHPTALFRLTVLGPLASRGTLKHGEAKKIIRELAASNYTIPDSRRTHLSAETITRWYYNWKRGGIEALNPKPRLDKGSTQLHKTIQEAIRSLKQDNPARSLNTLIGMIERQGLVCKGTLPRASIHRFLQQQKLSKRILPDCNTIERRSFVAAHAGDIWQGDVLHGPSIQTPLGMRKVYLVSLIDDASRLIVNSAFCLGETAVDIEGVLRDAILKRGLPHKLVVDNGPAYRAGSLQMICAHLDIRLIYCRPYEPEAKGKLERFHRTFREQFLNELDLDKISGLGDLNARLWAWLEQAYHTRVHGGLENQSPIERWREDLLRIRPITEQIAHKIDDIFCHRTKRKVKKDGTISHHGKIFEVDYSQAGESVLFVFDPHTEKPVRIESMTGEDLGPATLLDLKANITRKRQRPHAASAAPIKQNQYAVELTHEEYVKSIALSTQLMCEDN